VAEPRPWRRVRHLVLGSGAIGSATAFWLGERARLAGAEADVLVLEQYALGHDRGASEDHSRIIRHAYHSTDYTDLTAAAYAAWDLVAERTGLPLVLRTGGLDLGTGPAGEAEVASYATALAAAGHRSEVLDAAGIRRRWPQWRVSDDTVAVHQAESGVLDIRKGNAAHVALARQSGVRFQQHATVRRVDAGDDGVEVLVENGDGGQEVVAAETLSVCAGSWTDLVLADLDTTIPLTLTHEQVTYWSTLHLREFAPDRFGVWIHHGPEATYYGFPVYGEAAVKAGRDVSGRVVTQQTRTREPDEQNRADLTAFMAGHLPRALGPELATKTCVYDLTPDRNFVLDVLPECPRIAVFVGAGHAAKFAGLVGRVLADLACEGGTSVPVHAFRLDRPALTEPGPRRADFRFSRPAAAPA